MSCYGLITYAIEQLTTCEYAQLTIVFTVKQYVNISLQLFENERKKLIFYCPTEAESKMVPISNSSSTERALKVLKRQFYFKNTEFLNKECGLSGFIHRGFSFSFLPFYIQKHLCRQQHLRWKRHEFSPVLHSPPQFFLFFMARVCYKNYNTTPSPPVGTIYKLWNRGVNSNTQKLKLEPATVAQEHHENVNLCPLTKQRTQMLHKPSGKNW